jgi:hypothetical protein
MDKIKILSHYELELVYGGGSCFCSRCAEHCIEVRIGVAGSEKECTASCRGHRHLNGAYRYNSGANCDTRCLGNCKVKCDYTTLVGLTTRLAGPEFSNYGAADLCRDECYLKCGC